MFICHQKVTYLLVLIVKLQLSSRLTLGMKRFETMGQIQDCYELVFSLLDDKDLLNVRCVAKGLAEILNQVRGGDFLWIL